MIRWGDGIPPKNFIWVVPEKLAVCDCPGGFGTTRREARLKEELIWIRKNNFSAIIPLLPDHQMFKAYESMRIPCYEIDLKELPTPAVLHKIYFEIGKRLDNGQRLLVHRHTLDDLIVAFMGCFLLWFGSAGSAMSAEQAINQLFGRHISMHTRQNLVNMANWRQKNPPGAADSPSASAANSPNTAELK